MIVKIDSRLIGRIGIREWGYPSLCIPGQIWRSEKDSTITCMIPHVSEPELVSVQTFPLEITEPDDLSEMPDEWRDALWSYVQAYPSSGCGFGPFLRISHAERCDFIRKMAKNLVESDEIGCRHIAHDIGQFAALEFPLTTK
jgi:hypothetical protein